MYSVENVLSERYDNVDDAQKMIGRKVIVYDAENHKVVDVEPATVLQVFNLYAFGESAIIYRVFTDAGLTDCWADALLDVEGLIDEYLQAALDFGGDPEEAADYIKCIQRLREQM